MAESFQATYEPERPCPVCRGDRFLWGLVRTSEGIGTKPRFFADDQSFLGGLSGQGIGSVRTRMCVNCRHLEDFVVDGSFPLV